ncbi:Protein of unknown function [Bacillus cytotoxicus]|uniref:Uncharacterized protein n=1 Tax=Bacillus cytotoxicus TaxID=580165 RepID=A0AAX2CI32_9BACI|nr:Protein of unknown function [Bacillus cytotoxicus]SCN37941.1 Protein of unknown function [Bacillus cytotoxicus]
MDKVLENQELQNQFNQALVQNYTKLRMNWLPQKSI